MAGKQRGCNRVAALVAAGIIGGVALFTAAPVAAGPPDAQPDGAIRVTGGSFREFGFTSTQPTKRQTAVSTATEGEERRFRFRFQNIGTQTATYEVFGDGNQPGFVVKYFDSEGANITPEVIAGTYQVELDAGERSKPHTVRIKATGGSQPGDKAVRVVEIDGPGNLADVLRAKLKVV